MADRGEDGRLARWLGSSPAVLSSRHRRQLLDAAAARSQASSHGAFSRLRENFWTMLQIAAAAALAWLIANKALGHTTPFFAPVAAIMSLSATRGQRYRHALELMLGVALGIGLGELLIRAIGIGVLQLALTVGLAVAAAVLLGAGLVVVTEAGVSASLVATLAPSANGTFPPTRLLDALIGGATALLFSQILFPVNPVQVVREAAEAVVCELADSLGEIAAALERRDRDAAEEALLNARRTNADWGRFEQALDVGREAAHYAPARRHRRADFQTFRDISLPLDLIVRDVHVLARGAVRALMIDDPVPDRLIESLRDLGRATRELADRLGDDEDIQMVRSLALRATYAASELAPEHENLSLSVLVGYTQATAADVLRALGMERVPAHEKVGEAAMAAQR